MRWGISLYPEHSTVEQDCAYIEQASKHGFSRIFSCLLSVEGDAEQVERESAELTSCAHDNGMQVIFDVAPNVFSKLGISYDDLSFFNRIGADGIRLDEPFQPSQVADMTRNPYGLLIELNASCADGILPATLVHDPARDRLVPAITSIRSATVALIPPFLSARARRYTSWARTWRRLSAFPVRTRLVRGPSTRDW